MNDLNGWYVCEAGGKRRMCYLVSGLALCGSPCVPIEPFRPSMGNSKKQSKPVKAPKCGKCDTAHLAKWRAVYATPVPEAA